MELRNNVEHASVFFGPSPTFGPSLKTYQIKKVLERYAGQDRNVPSQLQNV